MKTPSAFAPVLALLFLVALPASIGAQNIASQTGSVSRGLEHLTLLTGPGLLSPAAGVALPHAASPNATKPSFRFVPAPASSRAPASPIRSSQKGTLILGSSLPGMAIPPAAEKPAARPDPESLRFQSKLETSAADTSLQNVKIRQLD